MEHKQEHSDTQASGNNRTGWLRASVLGSNDGILSTASLIIGVASANGSHAGILIAGISALVAGSMSMATGEYVSVSSQADSEKADIEREKQELRENRHGEFKELADIYRKRGLDSNLALQVAEQLMAHDALQAHTRDDLGILDTTKARPLQAAVASAMSFAMGSALPLFVVVLLPKQLLTLGVSFSTIIFLALLGVIGAKLGKANPIKAALRVTLWGALALLITAFIGNLFGTHTGN
jgi:vacuolar iron transporter family protein